MAEPPISKLTDDEATVLRRRLMGHARTRLASAGLRRHGIRQHPNYTDLGRAALAAYDAEQRRAIRVEVMRECEEVAKEEARAWAFDVESCGPDARNGVARAIRKMIAKEESNG